MGVKAFDLRLLVGRESIMGDKPRICIETVETCGKNLYVGTNDCFIHHFVIQEAGNQNTDKQLYTFKQQGKKHIGMKKPIIQIKTAKALNHLLVNCDSSLLLCSMLDMSVAVSVSGKIKNLSRFSVNERPTNRSPFAVEVCAAFLKKKSFQIFLVYVDRIVPMQEINLPDHPRNFCIDGKHICFATALSYYLINCETNKRQELFSINDNGKASHAITKISSTEFLISAANGLGVFVSSDGTSNRPPLQWSEGVFTTSHLQPYVIAMDDEFITVHSVLDQQQKQSISFQGGISLSCCDVGVVIVSTPKDLFTLTPVPLQNQIDSLIEKKQVDEALALVKLSKRKLSPDQFSAILHRTRCMSGFVKLQDFDADRALELFVDGCMDPRELICLFSGMLSAKSDFKRAVPPYHELVDINNICDNDKAKIVYCQEFLALYLESVSVEVFSANFQSEDVEGEKPKFCRGMDFKTFSCLVADLFYSTVLLFALLQRSIELEQFVLEKLKLLSNSSILDLIISEYSDDLALNLKKHGCYHACALLHLQCKEFDSALQVWRAIASKELNDSSFPGLVFVADQLAKSQLEAHVLWQNAEWILKLDQKAGVQIFTNESVSLDNIQPDDVIDFLHQYPDAVIDYLHYLVVVQKIQKEKFHTHLAVLYMEKVLKLLSSKKDSLALESVRKNLQEVLLQSDLYRIPLILGKATEAQLFEEQVILHSKLGEHEKSLTILVKDMKDFDAAKAYCLAKSEDDLSLRRQLFQILINVYLQDASINRSTSESTTAVLEILNQHPEDFDPETVLRLLPSHWSVALLSQFLQSTVRVPFHECKTKKIEYMLLQAELLRLNRERTQLHSTPVVVHENKMCYICNRNLNTSTFMRYPNGTVVHAHCSRDKHVCPVTGKIFKVKKSSFQGDS